MTKVNKKFNNTPLYSNKPIPVRDNKFFVKRIKNKKESKINYIITHIRTFLTDEKSGKNAKTSFANCLISKTLKLPDKNLNYLKRYVDGEIKLKQNTINKLNLMKDKFEQTFNYKIIEKGHFLIIVDINNETKDILSFENYENYKLEEINKIYNMIRSFDEISSYLVKQILMLQEKEELKNLNQFINYIN